MAKRLTHPLEVRFNLTQGVVRATFRSDEAVSAERPPDLAFTQRLPQVRRNTLADMIAPPLFGKIWMPLV